MVYIVEEMDHLILSMEACQDLGIIGEDFPTIGSHGAKEVLNVSVDEKVCKEKDEQIAKLQTQVNVLNKKIEKLEDQVDENEAYERRDTLIFSGSKVPAEVQDEKCDSVVLKLLENELKYKVSPNDISVAHRLGPKKNSQQSSTRSIIAKFCRRDAKTDIVSCARRAKPTGLFINESLIPQRHTVYYALRQAMRKLPNKVWMYHHRRISVCVGQAPSSGCSRRSSKNKYYRQTGRPVRKRILVLDG